MRSEEMHRTAEFGVAAHWDYKLGCTQVDSIRIGDSIDRKSLHLLPPVAVENDASEDNVCDQSTMVLSAAPEAIEPSSPSSSSTTGGFDSQSAGPYVTALVNAREDILNSQVYVFVLDDQAGEDHGELISVPVGSMVGDALQSVSASSTPSRAIRVFRNGTPAQLDQTVVNGDVLTLSMR